MTVTKEKNNKLIRNFLNLVINDKNLSAISDFFVEDGDYYTELGFAAGIQGVKVNTINWYRIFEPIQYSVTQSIIGDSYITFHLAESVRHQGTFKSIAATNKEIVIEKVIDFYVSNNKIKQYHVTFNQTEILAKLIDKNNKAYFEAINQPIFNEPYYGFFSMALEQLKTRQIILTTEQLKILSLWFNKNLIDNIASALKIDENKFHEEQQNILSVFNCENESQMFSRIKDSNLTKIINECGHSYVMCYNIIGL